MAANTYYFSGVPAAASKLVSSDTLAMNDVITYVVYNSDFYVTKSASATGTLTKVTAVNGLDTTFTVGGVDYTKSAISGLTTDALNRGNVGRSLVVYTDPYGYAIYAYVSTYADYLYVYANQPINTTTGVVSAKVVMEDGSVSTVNVSSMNSVPFSKNYWNEDWIGTDALARVIYGYTVNTDGTYNLIGVTQDTIYVPYTKGSTTWGQAGVDNASVVVDIRQMTANTTTNPVFTGKDNIPSMVNVELVYVKATADNDIDVGFLTAGKADDKTEIFVYQTANTSFTYDWTTNTGYASMDCVLNGVKVSGLELTRAQYEKIMQYGVGIYTYEGDELVFSSFDEEWGTVTWNNGTVWFKGESASYGEVDFAVLDISKGTATTFSLLNSGIDGVNGQRAIVRRDATGKISDVYFIVGTKADTLVAADGAVLYNVRHQNKRDAEYTYAVKPGYITNVIEIAPYDLYVGFYGAETADENQENDGYYDITISYAEALAASQAEGYRGGLVVDNGTVTSLIKDGKPVTVPDEPVNSTTDVVYYLNVTDNHGTPHNFRLTLEAAEGTTVLKSDLDSLNGRITTPDADYPEIGSIDIDGLKMSIQEFDDSLYTEDGAKITDRIYKNDRGEVTDMSQDLANVTEMTIVVKSEDGTKTQTYMLKDAAEDIIEAAELEKAKADAIKEIEEKMVDELEKADASNDPHLITDYEAALTDKDTEFSFSGTRTMNGLLYENWFKSIEKETDADKLASFLTSALGQCDAIAKAYVGALKTAADVAADQAKFKALANQKAQEYLTAIENALESQAIEWKGGTVEERVLAAIKYHVSSLNDYNMDEFTCEVEFSGDSFGENQPAQANATVKVTVTNTYAEVVSNEYSADITVTFTFKDF